jgi:hypothetical protein
MYAEFSAASRSRSTTLRLAASEKNSATGGHLWSRVADFFKLLRAGVWPRIKPSLVRRF